GTAYVAIDPYMFGQNDAGQTVREDGGVVIDVATGTITPTILIPNNVAGSLAVDSSTHKVYVSFPGKILVIDGTTNTLTGASIPMPGSATKDVYMAVDPATHHVFGYDGLG